MSISIFCGQATYSRDNKALEIQNYDELGQGCVGWIFTNYLEDGEYMDYQEKAIAWLPLEEMVLPNFGEKND